MDDVAIYIAFDGVFGTICCRGVLGVVDDADAIEEGFCAVFWAWETTLLTASDLAVDVGGGKGDIEIPVIEAEWAW